MWDYDGLKATELARYFYVWLLPQKNYLPLRKESFPARDRMAPKVPTQIGQAHDFREIRPGLWLSFKQEIAIYDYASSTPDKLVLANAETYEVKKAELDPKYALSFFRDIPVPKGIPVYEVKEGGTVVRLDEQTAQPAPAAESNPVLWLAVINVVLLGVAFLYWYRRRRTARVKA